MSVLKLNNKIGKLGEDISVKDLLSKNYQILNRNWLEKTGEIDIIAQKDSIIHFVEVKSVSCENLNLVDTLKFNPFDKVHHKKIQRIHKTIELYLLKNEIHSEAKWQIDLYAVYIAQESKQAKIKKFTKYNRVIYTLALLK